MLESRHVVLRCASVLLVVGGLAWSGALMALGLGDITVHSALNQPLKADIALTDLGGLRDSDLSVSLATPDEFGEAGIERVFFLNDLKFTPILHGNRNMIRVTSSKPVKEPFLNFLVQFNQPNGRLLREYTVLIDPPGSPGIVPATDEPDPRAQSSEFPMPDAPAPTAQSKPASAPAPVPATPATDAAAEQLAASILQNQQLQKTIDEQNLKLQAQEVLIADGKKQVGDLQARIAELQKPPPAPAAVAPVAPAPVAAPVEAQDDSPDWPLLGGLLVLLGALVGGLYYRRRQRSPENASLTPAIPLRNDPEVDEPQSPRPSTVHPAVEHRDEHVAGDVLEAVGIYLAYGRLGEAASLLRDALTKEPERADIGLQLLEVLGRQGDSPAYDAQETHLRQLGVEEQVLQDARARHPKLVISAPLTAAIPVAAAVVAPVIEARPVQPPAPDELAPEPGGLSMDSSWDLEDSRPPPEKNEAGESAFGAGLQVLPQDFELPETLEGDDAEASELEWICEPEAPPLDDDFLNEFGDPDELLDLPTSDPQDAANAGKLEQAQTCIDDGDIDSAIELLNELLKEADEPLRQTARTLLAGIR